uniref:ANK_REP_REGION domain-containing protein n=1 Tax=Anisakis simplex TaxID=6269 RepID=A0A0M3JH40_ANISI
LLVKRCPQLLNIQSEFGLTPLMSAVARDALGIVEALLELRVDLESVDGQGRTAMHHAASRGVSRQVAILLSWGASACRPDFECNRPMHYAAIKSHTASLRFIYRANKLIVLL